MSQRTQYAIIIIGLLLLAMFVIMGRSVYSQSDTPQDVEEALHVLAAHFGYELATPSAPTPTPTTDPTEEATSTPVASITSTSAISPTSTRMPTNTPEIMATATLAPTATATVLPLPISNIYPNCAEGWVNGQVHAWWFEKIKIVLPGGIPLMEFVPAPRHVHVGACMPLAGDGLVMAEPWEQHVRYDFFNNAGMQWQDRWRWESDYAEQRRIEPAWSCSKPPVGVWDTLMEFGDVPECQRYHTYTIQPSKAPYRIDDLRLETRVRYDDLGGTDHRVGLTGLVDTGQGEGQRATGGMQGVVSALRARSWYPESDYIAVIWEDIRDWIPAGSNQPLISGKVVLPFDFTNCGNDADVEMYLFGHNRDSFHPFHAGIGNPPEQLWSAEGCPDHAVELDSTVVPNGEYLLYVQANEHDERGTHSVALAVWVMIQN